MISSLKHNLSLWGLAPSKLMGRFGSDAAPKILANSIPKSGTHLLERLLYLLPGLSRQFERTLAAQDNTQLLERQCARLRKNQFLVCHLWYNKEFPRILDEFGIKQILLIRDPRDVVISNANYVTKINGHHRLHDYVNNHLMSDKERLHFFMRGCNEPEEYSISLILEKFYPWLQCENVLTIRFKDLIGKNGGGSDEMQMKTIDRILDFVGVSLDEAKKQELMEKIFYTQSKTFNKASKARINQWKSVFDDEDKKLFKELAGDWLIKYGFERDFDW